METKSLLRNTDYHTIIDFRQCIYHKNETKLIKYCERELKKIITFIKYEHFFQIFSNLVNSVWKKGDEENVY